MSLDRMAMKGTCGCVHGLQVAPSMGYPGPIPNEVQHHTPPEPTGPEDLYRLHVYGWGFGDEGWTWLGWWEWDPSRDDPAEQMVQPVTAVMAKGTHSISEMFFAMRGTYPEVWRRLDAKQKAKLRGGFK